MGSDGKPFIAFFGATGGCCLAALTRTLEAGYPCAALARNPTKLNTMLSDKGVPDSTVSALLTIVQGDIHDTAAISQVLAHNTTTASIIVSGIGAAPSFATLLLPVTICTDATKSIFTDATKSIFTDATKSIFTALRELEPTAKPLYVGFSSTGVTTGLRDVPWLLLPIYRLLGYQPHADKRNAENVVLDEMSKGDNSAIENYVIVRPSLLTYGPALGRTKVRAGTEMKPAVGYTISRDDIGGWIFEHLIDDHEERRKWVGEAASITY